MYSARTRFVLTVIKEEDEEEGGDAPPLVQNSWVPEETERRISHGGRRTSIELEDDSSSDSDESILPPPTNLTECYCTDEKPIVEVYPIWFSHVLAIFLFILGIPFLALVPYFCRCTCSKKKKLRCPGCGHYGTIRVRSKKQSKKKSKK